METLARRPANHARLARLTQREVELPRLLAEGRSNAAIADRLFVNGKTVETHVAHIFQKLDSQPTTEHDRRVLAALTWLGR